MCKDQLTGEKKPQNELWQAPNKKYYTSESDYLAYRENEDNRLRCIDFMIELLGYSKGMKIPTNFFNKLADWKFYKYDVVLDAMESQEDSLRWAINNKTFKNEVGKIIYLCTIIENHLNDSLNKKRRKEKQTILEEKVLVESDIDTEQIGTTRRGNDVSSLIGGDDDLWT